MQSSPIECYQPLRAAMLLNIILPSRAVGRVSPKTLEPGHCQAPAKLTPSGSLAGPHHSPCLTDKAASGDCRHCQIMCASQDRSEGVCVHRSHR